MARDKESPPIDPATTEHHPLGASAALYKSEAMVSWHDRKGTQHAQRVTGPTTLGSAPEAGVHIADDPLVSRLHLHMDPQRRGLFLTDLGSKNGTFHEGMPIFKACARDGERITVGNTLLTIQLALSKTETPLYPATVYGEMLGRSAVMRELFARLDRVAKSNASTFVHGETGTGKELVARAIHDKSDRAGGPYIVVDCAALPEHLLEAELFGHARGAFTGADRLRIGAFEEADGGTVFLDEIGELPVGVQTRLLRVLASGTVRRIGENEHRKIDVRFVSATHRDLPAMVTGGAFREDLYFRLAVLRVEVPALRDRREDIPILLERFLAEEGVTEPIGAMKLDTLTKWAWLGNVRDLRNFARRVKALGVTDAMYASEDARWPKGMIAGAAGAGVAGAEVGAGGDGKTERLPGRFVRGPYKEARRALLDALVSEYVAELHERHGGDQKKMLAEAQINASHLWKLQNPER